MKVFFAIFLMLYSNVGWCAGASVSPQMVSIKGEVLEVKDVENYTYLRLKTKDGETWAAVNKAQVKKGAVVTIENAETMDNFTSKALNKTFDKIIFGSLGGAGANPTNVGRGLAGAHADVAKAADVGDVKVPKAEGADAQTIVNIVTKRTELKNKTIRVRGKVVKYNSGILGKNWIHLRDGSGSAADNTNDVLVTTTDTTKVGDVIIVKGVVRTDMNLGAGYAYKVLVEEAKLFK